MSEETFFRRLADGLEKTRKGLLRGPAAALKGKIALDRSALEELEMQLITADIGVEATATIMTGLDKSLRNSDSRQLEALSVLRRNMVSVLIRAEQPLTVPEKKPFVILVVGVNGAGKTTTIGKIAHFLQQDGYSLLLAAGDTFRAAAVEQIQRWGEKIKAPVIAQNPGADPAAVIYDALQSAVARGTDIVIADTAGRLHNKDNLMEELKKATRTIRKFDPTLEVEVLLVIDAGTGQNAIVQAQRFQQAVGVTGVALTKLDGTAKGGVAFSIAHNLLLPIRFIGVGEGIGDLQPFNADHFVRALLELRP